MLDFGLEKHVSRVVKLHVCWRQVNIFKGSQSKITSTTTVSYENSLLQDLAACPFGAV
jgi:hypothetical protein